MSSNAVSNKGPQGATGPAGPLGPQHVDSVVDLRASSPAADGGAILAGKLSIGDGGGGTFYVDPNDTTSVDDGALTVVTSGGTRIKRLREGRLVDVKWFGAKGDGTTNDLLAIQAAADALLDGDTLYFPPGRYKLDWIDGQNVGNIRLSGRNGLGILGDGPQSVIYDARPETDYNGESAGGMPTSGVPVFNGTTDSSGTLSLINCSNILIRDVRLESTGTATSPKTLISRKAIYGHNFSGSLRVIDCEFHGYYGEVAYGTTYVAANAWVDRCKFTSCTSNNVNISSNDREMPINVTNCSFTDIYSAVAVCTFSGRVLVSGCQFYQNVSTGGYSIALDAAESFVIVGNLWAGWRMVPRTGAGAIAISNVSGTYATTANGLIACNTIVDCQMGTKDFGGAILLDTLPAGQILVTGNVVLGNGYSTGDSPGVSIINWGESLGIVPACAYIIQGNTFGRGSNRQEIGVRVNPGCSGYDIRVGDNVYDCNYPIDIFTESALGEGRLPQMAQRTTSLSYYAGSSKGNTACKPVSFSATNATPAAVQTYTPPANGFVAVTASVSMVKSDGSDAWAVDLVRRFRVVAGVVTAMSATTIVPDNGNTAALAADIDTSGGVLRVMVTGIANQTWRGLCETGIVVRTTEA